MKIQIVIAILLIGFTTQQCTIGCLVCSSLNQCSLCDITNNYFINGNACQLSSQTNCLVLAQNGNCAVCNNNFYLDVNSQRCLAVTSANVIASCSNYNSGQICTACTGNFFIFGGRCSAVNVTISNCNSYLNNGVCSGCASGFILSNDLTTCVAIPINNNCLVYTYIGCKQCSTGFVNNQNYYFTNSLGPSSPNFFLVNMVIPTVTWYPLNVCQPVAVNNCLVYASFNICTQCNSGFFLQNGNCVAFPLPIIFGCQSYSNLVTCSVCQPGMFLSQNTCVNNAVIPNCLIYSGSASTTTCLQCNVGFFLQGTACVARAVSLNISNCQTVAIGADLCGVCALNFVLTTDLRACLSVVANCNQYAVSSVSNTVLQCSLCNIGFYLASSGNANICVAGSVAFCQTYAVNSNTCTICTNGNYLSGNVCIAHVVIQNCLNYDPIKANFCNVCNSGFYNFAFTTTCVSTSLRTACAAYSVDGNSCVSCNAGFFLAAGNCNLIPSTFANCNVFSGTLCTLCNSGYMINTLPTVGTCTLPMDYINSVSNSPCSVMQPVASGIIPTWLQTATATQTPLTCATCNNYMYGYAPQNSEAICVNSNQLILYSGFTSVSQCSRYGLDYATTQVIVCMQCGSGYFLSGYQALGIMTVLTSCVSSCSGASTNSNAVIPDDFFGFVNICVTVAGAGAFTPSGTCQRYARFQSQNINLITANSIVNDYKCLLAAPSTTTLPTVFLQLDPSQTTAGTAWYSFEIPSQTTPVTASSDFSSGYSNTVDSNSNVPTVFNYKGIMPVIASTAFTILAANVLNNNLNNCDIIVNYPAAYALNGWSWDATAASAALYTAAGATAYYSCLRCNFGFQLSYVASGVIANNPVFPSCVQMTNCASSNTVYGGLPTFLNTVFSCHVCSQSSGQNNFPSIYFETNGVAGATASGSWTGWTIRNVYSSVSAIGQANHGFRCAAAPASLTITDSAAATVASISNCAAYGYIQPISTFGAAAAGTQIYNTCLACGANFYPTYLVAATPSSVVTSVLTTTRLPNFIVTGCVASANCDTSVITQFNSCGRCRTDLANALVPAYYAYIDFTLSNCYQSITQYCFILTASGFSNTATNNACFVCMAGYFKNSDGMCEVYRVPNQAVNTGVFVNSYYVSRAFISNVVTVPSIVAPSTDAQMVRLHYLLSWRQLQYGASSCSSGWVQAPVNTWAPRLCVWSSYVYNNTGSYPTTSVFINNCVRYNLTQVGGKNICGGCNTGFIPTVDGLSCVVSNSAVLTNCIFAQTGSNNGLCFQCAVNFMNVNGLCVNTPIANCATYVNTVWSFSTPGTVQCATCLNGFVLSADFLSCSAGNVINCISYAQGLPNQCTNCNNGFVLLTLASVYYCYPIPSSLNCAQLQDTSSTSGANLATISCARCLTNSNQVFGTRMWTSLGLTSQAQTICMPFTAIANCNVYDQNNLVIKSNSFNCLQCANGFWFSSTNTTCVPRLNQPTQCLSYSNSSDVCLSCAAGSFLSANGQQCVLFPNGIFNCNQYSAANVCIRCNSGSFLSNNACVLSTLVNNCAIYAGNFTCATCAQGFFLFNSSSCVTPGASNCLTYNSINACASCAIGFGIQTANGVSSCVSISLANCVNATTVAPFSCLVCATGFFPNSNGICTLVSATISSCLVYDTATTCVRCSQNSVLNVARTACNSTFYTGSVDANCAQSFLLNTPSCLECALGSFFVNGTCVACSNNTLASGCLQCNPLNVNSCLICRPGFYMNAQGNCLAVNPTPNPTPNPTNNTNGTISIAKSIALSLAVVTLFFDQL